MSFFSLRFPLTKLGLLFTLTLTFLGLLHLLGEQGVRLGSLLFPRVDPRLFLGVWVLSATLATVRSPMRILRFLVTLGVLTGVAILLRSWHATLSAHSKIDPANEAQSAQVKSKRRR